MPSKKISIKTFVLIIIASMLLASYLLSRSFYGDLYSKSIICLVCTIMCFSMLLFNEKTLISPYLLFFYSFCIYQAGQFYLYALHIDYDYLFTHPFYSQYCSIDNMLEICDFTTCGIIVATIAGLVTTKTYNNGIANTAEFEFEKDMYVKVYKFLFLIGVPASFLYYSIQAFFAIVFGFDSIRGSLIQSIPGFNILNRLDMLFIPAVVLGWMIYLNDRDKQKRIELLILIHAMISLISGVRTIGLGEILMLLYMRSKTKKDKKTNYLAIVISFVAIMALSTFVAYNRSAKSLDIASLLTAGIIGFIGECGFSLFPLMVICQGISSGTVVLSKGFTYFASVLGFFPTFLDPTGFLDSLTYYSTESWLYDRVGFDFGIGFSLLGEAYYNFQWFGLLSLFVVCIIVGKVLYRKGNGTFFSSYVSIVMLFAVLTLPRRTSFSLFNYLFYFVFLVWFLRRVEFKKKN